MRIEILCDQCHSSFMGEDSLMDEVGEVLCENCLELSRK